MEIEYDRRDDHAVDISSDHEFAAAPSQANNSVADQHTSHMAACDSTGASDASTSTTVHQTSSSESIKRGPSHDQQADDDRKHGQNRNKTMSKKATEVCLSIPLVFLVLLVTIVVHLIAGSLALVITCTLIPGIIICLVLAYMITSLHQFSRCDDYDDMDDEYDTELGTYRYDLVHWMVQLTGILIGELLLCLALFRIGPFALRRLSLLHLRVWKWFLIGIIVLVYFGFWLLTHIVIHKARETSSLIYEGVFFRVHVLPILKGMLSVVVCGLYFLVELLFVKLCPPTRGPKILGLYAHKWIHVLVYIFIGLNVSQIISASIIAMLLKKREDAVKSYYKTILGETEGGHGEEVLDFMRHGCRLIVSRLFRHLYTFTGKYTGYVVIGLRRSFIFVLISIWLLLIWISDFEHQVKPSHDTTWIHGVGTGTLISLLICAILGVVKNSIMLWWKYRSIYKRYWNEVFEGGIKLYFLGTIYGPHLDVLNIRGGYLYDPNNNDIKKEADQNRKNNSSSSDINDKDSCKVDEKKKHAEEEIKKGADQNNNNNNNSSDNDSKEIKKAEDITGRIVAKARRALVFPHDLVKAHRLFRYPELQLSIYDIKRMVKYFLQAEDTLKKDDQNASIEELRNKWRQAFHPSYDQNARSTPLTLDHINAAYGAEISDEDFKNLLYSIKGDEHSEKQVINLQDFERWMERSHKTCFNIVSRLSSEQRLAQYLDLLLIAVIILATIVIWLILVTGGTKAVSLLGAPLVALSFIFGETCSTFFKGIIFSYVIHPYGIGDICLIKDTWYEVKQINIWRTTFLKVATNEFVFCPNSSLFNETIIYQTKKTGDSLEFILESNTNGQNILELKERIDDYFVKQQSTNFQKPQVEVQQGIGDTRKPKVTIRFKHNLKDFLEMSSSVCLQEMNQRREELKHRIMELCPDLKIKELG